MRYSVLALAVSVAGPALAAADDFRVPASARLVPDSYIVVLKDGVAARRGAAGISVSQHAVDLAARHGGSVTHFYETALQGFAIRLPEAAARLLARDPRVAWVEQDTEMHAVATQSPATWGIDRLDQRDLPLSNSYTYNFTGSGVHAYIIDTGVRATHAEFAGRMGNGTDTIDNDGNPDDCNGHGTHVAGTVGGTTYGVAKGVTLHAVRVLNCQGSGTNAQVIAGVDWVTANHVKPAVANMSLGGGANTSLDTAVANSINAGVTYAIAAGNSNANACNSSPARVAAAITVGATTNTDARSSFSNFGTCLDIFAPGSSITSSWNTSNTATNTISGTSMATPHVAGVAALYLAENGHQAPATVRNALVDNATSNKVTSPGTGSPNKLLHSIFGGTPPPGDTTPPTTDITSPGNGATVSGTITITASANDNVGVARVDFLVDGVVKCSDTSTPYSCAWNTATSSNGSHGLQSRAYDAANNVGTSATVTVTVSNGGGGSCPDGQFAGTLSGSGDFDYQPNGTYYFSAGSGVHRGILDGPNGVDFDLYLYKWNSFFGWLQVASSTSANPDEAINYSGTSGYYLWEVYSYSGSGSYTLCLDHP